MIRRSMSIGTGGRACARFALLVGMACVAGGCAFLNPTEDSLETRFKSFEAAQTAFEAIEHGKTGTDELVELGIDPGNLGTQILPYTGIVGYFLVHQGVRADLMDPAVVECFRVRQECQIWYVNASRDKGRRTTAWLLDTLRFHRRKVRSGYWFEGIVFVQNDVATYSLYRGRPNYRAVEELIRPLGPLQSGPHVEVDPLDGTPRLILIGDVDEEDNSFLLEQITSILQDEGELRQFRVIEIEPQRKLE